MSIIDKFKEFNESDLYSEYEFYNNDELVTELFLEYIDNGAKFKITEGYIDSSNYYRKMSSYVKIDNIKSKCKLYELSIPIDKSGISGSITDINILLDLYNIINRFYKITKQDVNYNIKYDFTELLFSFYLKGDVPNPSIDITNKIDLYMKELKSIIYRDFSKRGNVDGNIIYIRNLNTNTIIDKVNHYNPDDYIHNRYESLLAFRDKLRTNGLRMYSKVVGDDYYCIVITKI